MIASIVMVALYLTVINAVETTGNCRSRSNHLRQDGGLCFEVPPWEHQPVQLEQHLMRLRDKWGHSNNRRVLMEPIVVNSEVSRYMDTILAPFLDTYHRNIQNLYQQLTEKILQKAKEEMNMAVQKKNQISTNLTELANTLKVPGTSMCNEERRAVRSLSSKHVARIYACTEDAKASIAQMGNYAEEMISITKKHMLATLEEKTISFKININNTTTTKAVKSTTNVTVCLKELSRAAVNLGYELDLSLTNARRYNEQSCERLSSCCTKVRRYTEEDVKNLQDLLYQCVYA